MSKLRVWHNCQVGKIDDFYVDVESVEQEWCEWYDDGGLGIRKHFEELEKSEE